MQSLASQDVAQMGGRFSVLTRQKADHVRLDALLHRLSGGPPEAQRSTLRTVYRLVFPHAFAEEAVLWPVIRRVLPDGQELTLRVEQEHQAINELVTHLDSLVPGTPEHREVLDRIVELLREDVRDEEDMLLPRLQAKLSPAQLRVLGFAWAAVRRIAPTRAHPVVARRPPGNMLSALPLTILDRSRDRVEAMTDRLGAAASPLHLVGAALAGTSQVIEHLPGMASGEDPSTRMQRARRFPWAAAGISIAVAALALRGVARSRQ